MVRTNTSSFPGTALPPASAGFAMALLAGATLALFLPWTLPGWLCAGLGACAGVAYVRWPRLAWLAVLLAGLAWSGQRASWALAGWLPPALEGQEVQVTGRVLELPDAETRRTRFLLRVDRAADIPAALRGRRLQVSWYDDFGADAPGPRVALHAGERWQFRLRVRAPRGLVNPGGFDAERNALARHISASALVRAPDTARRIAPASGTDAWRERMSERIRSHTPPASGRYVQALALGDTRGLDDNDWQVLRANGLTHLIAISGFHVGMVAGGFALLAALPWWLWPALGRRWPRPQAMAVAAMLGGIGYAAVAGFSLPTVRTVLMIAVVACARLLRRRGSVGESLAIAAIAIVAVDPLGLLTAGFWLSFAGVAWLAWCLGRAGDTGVVKGFLSAQGVATLGLLPFTAILFGQASLAGPLANVVAIPWWSLVVVPLSLLGTALEALHAGWGIWAWRLASGCFELSWPLFQWLARSRFALVWLPEARDVALPLALLAAFWWLMPRALPGKALATLLWLPLLWPERDLPQAGEAELTMLDVGQGLAIVVRTRHHVLLYDAGPAVADGYDAGERVVVPALRALGVAQLHAMVVGHGDSDHAGGVQAVRSAVPTAWTLAPSGSPVADTRDCVAGDGWSWDGVRFRFLHPSAGFPYLGNESSCVLRIETGHGTALLTGDIGPVIEQRLLRDRRRDLRADVVAVAHHGSGGSSQPAFIGATGARLALVSAGHGNRFGHPRQDVVRRWQRSGAEVVQTSSGGALRVWLGHGGLQLREYRPWRARLWDAARHARVEHATAILSVGERKAAMPED